LTGLLVRLGQHHPIALDVDISCARGELIALVGPSGSGKSTILRAIAGIFNPAYAYIKIEDQIWSSTEQRITVAPHRRAVGMVFQHYALFPHMNVLQNITCSMSTGTSGEQRSAAMDLLEKINLTEFKDRFPHQLSGGQQQRVAVARALARDPQVLLLDEPFAAVDRITRRRLYREIIRLRRDLEIPVILVTHDLDEAATLADRMYVLHQGKTLQSGTPHEVTSKPTNALVAGLVDLRNLFDAIVTDQNLETGNTTLQWSGVPITLNHKKKLSMGEQVKWVIPDGSVLVNRIDRNPSRSRPNSIDCLVAEVLFIGQAAQLVLYPSANRQVPLHASLPARVIHNNKVKVGSNIDVSLDPDRIHILNAD